MRFSPRITLQKVLDNIRAVCDKHGVMYNLEKTIGPDEGARIRIAYFQPEHKINYLISVTAGTHVGREDILEEECLFEVDWDGNKWAHKFTPTMKGRSSILIGLESQFVDACTGTNWDEAYKNIVGDGIGREMVRLWNAGYNRKDIAAKVHLAPKTVTNKITKLRRANPEWVLTNERRKSLGRLIARK